MISVQATNCNVVAGPVPAIIPDYIQQLSREVDLMSEYALAIAERLQNINRVEPKEPHPKDGQKAPDCAMSSLHEQLSRIRSVNQRLSHCADMLNRLI